MQDVSVSITLDGNAIGRYYLAPGQKMLPGLYVSETLTKPFRFRDLVLTSMDSVVLRADVVTDFIPDDKGFQDLSYYTWDNTGSIDFSIYRCSKTRIEQFRPQDTGSVYGEASIGTPASEGRARSSTPSIS